MGRRGPRAEPSVIRLARGNPGKRAVRSTEPRPAAGTVSPPEWLTGVSLEKWHELVPLLSDMRVLTPADVGALARYCLFHEQMLKYADMCRRGLDISIGRDDQGRVKYLQVGPAATLLHKASSEMLRLEQEFGLTPSARSGIDAGPSPEEDLLSSFRARKAQA